MPETLTAALIAYGVIFLVELPDKTLVASLVLSTRYRPRPVLVGVGCAFALQSLIAVTAGGLLNLLPERLVEAVVGLLFAVGAVILIRESLGDPDEVDLDAHAQRQAAPFFRVVLTSFGVIFAAEWGDASQLATAGLAARLGSPVAVGLGAWLALMTVATIAAVAGRIILKKVPVRRVHLVAGVGFALFAVLAGTTAVAG